MSDSPVQNLLSAFHQLPPWGQSEDFSQEDWRHYIEAGRLIQSSKPADVEQALAGFLTDAAGFTAVDNETRLFLLMRVVFDLPNRVPGSQQRVFKGWINWPEPDAGGDVSLSWPIDWNEGKPRLLGKYEGADGPRYAVVEEYRYLITHFPLRNLPAT